MNVKVCEIYLNKAVTQKYNAIITYHDYKIIPYMNMIICNKFKHQFILNNYIVFNFKHIK